MTPENTTLNDVREMATGAQRVLGYKLFAQACGLPESMTESDKKSLISDWADGASAPDQDHLDCLQDIDDVIRRFVNVISSGAVRQWFNQCNALLGGHTPASYIASRNDIGALHCAVDVRIDNM